MYEFALLVMCAYSVSKILRISLAVHFLLSKNIRWWQTRLIHLVVSLCTTQRSLHLRRWTLIICQITPFFISTQPVRIWLFVASKCVFHVLVEIVVDLSSEENCLALPHCSSETEW